MIRIADIYSANDEQGLFDLKVGELTNITGGAGDYIYGGPGSYYNNDPVDINDISTFLSKIDGQIQVWWSKIDGTAGNFKRGLNI